MYKSRQQLLKVLDLKQSMHISDPSRITEANKVESSGGEGSI